MFESIISGGLTLSSALICTAVSLGMGLLIAFVYLFRSSYSRNFLMTLALIPVIIQAVIMMVNGNIGTGVAVMGAFSLVRFRSVPGNSKDISCIFFAVTVGIATGIGQIWFAIGFTVIVCAIFLILKFIPVGEARTQKDKSLRITVPEDCEFDKAFEDVFKKYTTASAIEKIKTSGMGSLYVVNFKLTMKGANLEKQLIDELRERNGNLPIVCTVWHAPTDEL